MCIAVVGGMIRFEKHYKKLAQDLGIDLKVLVTSWAQKASKIIGGRRGVGAYAH